MREWPQAMLQSNLFVHGLPDSVMRNMHIWGTIREALRDTGLEPHSLRAGGTVLWRGVLLGTLLCLFIGPETSVNLKMNAASYVVALIWCYYDGVFSRRVWSLAWLEAIFLHLAGVQFGNLLRLAF